MKQNETDKEKKIRLDWTIVIILVIIYYACR